MPLQVAPQGDNIIVQEIQDDVEATSPAGIILPLDEPTVKSGRVLHVGPGMLNSTGKRTKPDVSVGNTVVFPAHVGFKVELQGEDGAPAESALVMRASDVLFSFASK